MADITVGELFSGYGGLGMAVRQVFPGAVTVWHADIKPASRLLLETRYPGVPNLGDVTRIDWSAQLPPTVITGGFPCTDLSNAGRIAGMIRTGAARTRSGLWFEMLRAVDALRPALVLIENVRNLTNAPADCRVGPCPGCVDHVPPRNRLRALGAVLGDLADIGFDAAWTSLHASDVGAPHKRDRTFVVGWPQQDPPGANPAQAVDPVRAALRAAGRGGAAADSDPGREDVLRPGSRPAAHPGADGDRGADRPADAVAAVPVQWGVYGPAVRRWERLSRPAPFPVDTNPAGRDYLNPRLVEWMMGLPDGWITDVPGLTPAEMLSLTGDGVVPQQAAAALRRLLAVREDVLAA